MMKKGFTLIEMMVAVSVLSLILVVGTTIFYRALFSGSISDTDVGISVASRALLKTLENGLVYSNVISLSSGVKTNTRRDCIIATSEGTGAVGNVLTVLDDNGKQVVYSLSENRVASNGAIISSSKLNITDLTFYWYCNTKTSDRLKIVYTVAIEGESEGAVLLNRVFTRELLLLNSGLR